MKNFLLTMLIDNFLKKGVFKILPDKQYIVLDYFLVKKEFPNLKNPQTFSDKIQWIKVYGNLKNISNYADKYTVRDYVAKTIGPRYLVPLLGVYEKFDDIPFDKFPNKFILKISNGSGNNFICKDKRKLNLKDLKKTVNKWMSVNYYYEHREIQYLPCVSRIVCEEYLEDGNEEIKDFKFFCKNGEPQMVEVYSDVQTSPKVDMVDLNWKKQNVSMHFSNSTKDLKKPKQISEMLSIVKKLSKKFPFVRVDLYLCNNKVYFGELTFTPGNGMYIIKPVEADLSLGSLIDLSSFN